MEAFRAVLVAVLSVVGGYFGYKLTNAWVGIPIGSAIVGYATVKLLVGEFVAAGMALCVGAFALFHFMVSGAPDLRSSAPAKSGEGFGAPAIVFEAAPPGGAASGAAPSPKENLSAVDGAPVVQGASAVGALGTGSVFKECPDCPTLVKVPAGQFVMGSTPGAPVLPAQTPAHSVTIRSFAIGEDAVTQAQFSAFVTAANYQTDAERLGGCFGLEGQDWEFKARHTWRNPGFAQSDNHPVVCVTWNDANAYLQWLSATTGQKYRLPSEAEREYATRAGSSSAYWWGDSITMEQANFRDETYGSPDSGKRPWRKATVAVRQFAANPFGLYNVHGNVWEWVQDCQHNHYNGAPLDGSAWTSGCVSKRRGARGGDWTSPADGLRAEHRAWFEPDLPSYAGGFRVARDL